MPPRPYLRVKLNRPISAIYIGKDADSHSLQSTPSSSSESHTEATTSPRLPDLPEPPSPSSGIGSVQSGLPSPPRTNSTSSEGTGDPASISFRDRSLSHHSNSSDSTLSGTANRSLYESEAECDDYDKENANDNDNDSNDDTARLNVNVVALQRAKSLAERNRMDLSKQPPTSAASPHRHSPPHSGLITEREINSPTSLPHHLPSPSLSSVSLRDPSHQHHTSSSLTTSPNLSHSRRRKRASTVDMSSLHLKDFEDDGGLKLATSTARTRTRNGTLSEQDLITQSALAAVASSRSPLSSRRRAGLPKDFSSDLFDDSTSPAGPETGRISVADTQKESRPVDPVTPTRPSTSHDYRHGDFGSPSTGQYNTLATHSNKDGSPKSERRQTLRGGSAESALLSPGGRSLIREGLKAAGLSKKRQEDRGVEWSPEKNRLHPPRAATSMDYRYMDNEGYPDSQYHDTDRPGRRFRSRDRENSLPRAANSMTRERKRDSISMDRTGSSFVRYNHNGYVHTPSPVPLLSTPRRTLERLPSPSPFGIRRLNAQTPVGGSSSNQTEHIKLMLESLTMLETQLNRVPLGKVVDGSTETGVPVGTDASQIELAKNTRSMVYSAEWLSDSLKKGNGRAVEEQVEAEVEESSTGPDAQEIRNVWGRVAAEYRENSRVADELVRGMTGFMLGIGRVMRDIEVSTLADYEGGSSPSAHKKHASLDADEEGRSLRRERDSPDVGSAGSGRRSALSRNSPESGERDRMVVSSGSGGSGAGGQRPESVLARASPATYQRLRSRERELQLETPPPHSQQQRHIRQASNTNSLPESDRKLFTPREQREQILDAKFSSRHGRPVDGSGTPMRDSQETVQLQSSPKPASRTRDGNSQKREKISMLSPLKFPGPLPKLASETLGTLVRRQTINSCVERIDPPTPAANTIGRDRRSTIRNSLPAFSSPSNATKQRNNRPFTAPRFKF